MVVSFGTVVDPDTTGYVEPVKGDTGRWHLALHPDLLDSPQLRDNTIVHELGHLITLNGDQVSTPESRIELRGLADTCRTWFTGDGCSREGSYMAAWVKEFWPDDLMEEWASIEESQLGRFVDDHEGVFISAYAATSPSEDIAESFAEWVLGRRNDHLGEVAAAKLAFFEGYPELVVLRTEIRSRR
jgi:hypothetical protein